jgi:molecular chaperone DnaK
MPQIEVTFDIDANAIMHVSAKDNATGKEQKIEIKAGSGLTEAEIEAMVNDAEAHAEEDRKFHETVTARNSADAMVHSTRSTLKEMGDKIGEDDRKSIEAAIEGVEEAMKLNDKDAIEAATGKLTEAAQVIYQQAQAEAEAAAAGAQDAGPQAEAAADDVVDAEFEEVDDKKDENK